MLLITFLSLQVPETSGDSLVSFLPDRCRAASVREDEVVVCGRRNGPSPYRIGPQAPSPPTLPDARFQIADGVEGKVSTEQGDVGGIPTNRAMVSLKIKF